MFSLLLFSAVFTYRGYQTTIQVSNYYKNNLTELDVAAAAPNRSPTPTQRKELGFPTSVTLTPSTPVPVPTSMPASTQPKSVPTSGVFLESVEIPRQPTTAPTSTFPERNVSAGKPLSSDGIVHSPLPSPWYRSVSRISQPLSRPNPSIRPGYYAMDTRPEYPSAFPHDPRILSGKPLDNVNLGRGSIAQYEQPTETRQYLPASYSPTGSGRGYRPPGPSHGSSPMLPSSQNVRTPYVYPPPRTSPWGRSRLYPPEHSTYVGFRFTPEAGRSSSARHSYPPIHPESLQGSPPPVSAHSGPSLNRRLEPPYPDYPNTLVTSPTTSSTRTPSRPPYPHYSERDSES